jgi:hypothetical protein
VQIVAVAAPNGWDRQALGREQLADKDNGQLMRMMEAEQHSKWGISDWGPIYKNYCAQLKSLAVRDSILESHWELANR